MKTQFSFGIPKQWERDCHAWFVTVKIQPAFEVRKKMECDYYSRIWQK